MPIKCRLESYKKSFVPSTIETWNNLPDSIRNSNKLFTFQTHIKKHFNIDKQANPRLLYHSHGSFFGKLLNQIKFKLSPLKAHLFSYNLTDNPFCSGCGEEIESTHHFLLTCNAYAVPRQQLLLISLEWWNCNLVSDDNILNCIIVGSNGRNSEDCIRLNTLIFGFTCAYFYATKIFGSIS